MVHIPLRAKLAFSVIHPLIANGTLDIYLQNSVSYLVFENVGDQMLFPMGGMRFALSFQCKC